MLFVILSLTTMTSDILSLSYDEFLTVSQTQKRLSVEGRLWRTYKALAATESNIYLFNTLKKQGLATNDVRNFVEKQKINKKVKLHADKKVKKSAMQSKLSDALAYAKRLRQDKNTFKSKVSTKYRERVAKGRRVLDEIHKRYLVLRDSHMGTAKKKVEWYREKEILTKPKSLRQCQVSQTNSGVTYSSKSWIKFGPGKSKQMTRCFPSTTSNAKVALIGNQTKQKQSTPFKSTASPTRAQLI